ncbi:MAG: hypothetical protein IJV70_02440, partial [Clostridia bacterium]|nr:hypothetical protein [Clostridia bacterium]
QYFMYEKPRARLCERVFSVPYQIYHGLSFFFLRAFFFFLSRKKEEKREIYIKRNLKEKL